MRISDWSSDVCSSDLHIGVGGDGDTRRARRDQRIMHGAKIARAIVDQGDGPMPLPQAGGESHSTPWVLGIVSPLRGSISTAWRSARASDLYMLSAIWWLFSPYRVSMCSVMPAACAKLANQCGNISVSISPSRGCEKPDFQTQCGRPEMSRVQERKSTRLNSSHK